MIKTFTKNDVVRGLYRETSPNENEQIKLAKLTDGSFGNEIDEMERLKKELDDFFIAPPAHVTAAILKAARW